MAEEALGKILLSPDSALSRLPAVDLSADDVRRVRNGLSVKVSNPAWSGGERVRVRDEMGNLIAVADFNAAEGWLHPSVVIARDET
jgi:tRNA U55 pseudouridine synthase TruB